ncbi:MAG: RimK family protein [Candidatus Eisenbacteria bacterium]|uniref:RimK family protein n=1 Tax=Eiseniibacteriota bacterium TaxID=2212470 RepID=A0A956LYZ5_UNCEI|nr:RimK family protein [Candidatus Eisenbacteria bacterium]
MTILVVVNNPKNWPLHIDGVELIAAREYLTNPAWSKIRAAKVFNLCRSYSYQSLGYYVSLLAEARGHRPLPAVSTVQDLKNQAIQRLASEDIDELIQKNLHTIHSAEFELSIYFGRNLARKYDRLSLGLFNMFPAPLLRASFKKVEDRWTMQNIRPIAASEIPQSHRPFVVEMATEYFAGRVPSRRKKTNYRYDLAILIDSAEENPPSNEKALEHFKQAAEAWSMHTTFIEKDDYGRLAEFDALFIRETTSVDHHTFRFAARAAAEGMVVIDDPQSILRCTNKVYLAEVLQRHGVPTPRSVVVHEDNLQETLGSLGLPCILKMPDSAFSQGVFKIDTEEEFVAKVNEMLEESDLIIAQEFLPSEFDWRIGVLNRQPLYACRYYMADQHWQIINWKAGEEEDYGKVQAVPIHEVPPAVVRNAVKAANLMGDGLYGVDMKQKGKKGFVIEVNDNPSLDAGYEDGVLGPALYERVMSVFVQRIESGKRG